MDRLTITGLALKAKIGVYHWEQIVEQTILLDLQLAIDVAQIAKQDQLDSTIDYAGLQESLQQFMSQQHFQLIETLAEQTADFVLNNYATDWVHLTAHKPGACPGAKDIAVTIERRLA